MDGSQYSQPTRSLGAAGNSLFTEFEEAWKARPRIEDYLSRSPPQARAELLKELVRLDMHYRRQRGERPTGEEYLSRFPQMAGVVEEALSPESGTSSTVDHVLAFSDDTQVETDSPWQPPAGPRFSVKHKHAEGGLGEVYLAEDRQFLRDVALKQVKPRRAHDQASRGQFMREALVTGRLEHPGIVPVYALGQHADGQPYYVMRFIQGENLQKAIDRFHAAERPCRDAAESPRRDAAERRLTLRKLLGQFVDVCNAVEYAHSRCVLHRDLKPANVMLGEFGETLVVDWGLAKELAAEYESHAGSGGADDGTDGDQTRTSQMVGTLGYMSPEQAAGRLTEMGPPADVFSLGATLYAILTGKSSLPAAESDEELLRLVRAGSFARPRQVSPRIPAALEAICLTAMAAEPDQRYASAKTLADEVEHFLADERVSAHREGVAERTGRWLRRHKAAARAGAVALVVVSIVSTAAAMLINSARAATSLALAAETQATNQARQAIENYVKTVEEDELLKEQRFKPLLKKLLKDALEYYQTFAREHQNDPVLQADVGKALFKIGWISERSGSKDDALAAYQRTLAIRETLIRESPSVAGFADDLATTHNNLGNLLSDTGRTDEALAAFEQARAIQQDLTRENPRVAKFFDDSATTHINLGNLFLHTGRPAEAQAAYEQARTIQEKLTRENPSVAQFADGLALTHTNLGNLFLQTGRPAEAQAAYEQARAIQEKLTRENPSIIRFAEGLARTHHSQGVLFHQTGRPAEALAAYQQARAIQEKLTRENPSVTGFADSLAKTHNNLGNLLRESGRPAEAQDDFQQARAIQEKLTRENPSVTEFASGLAATHTNLGLLFRQTGRLAEAQAAIEQARALWENLTRDNPSVTEFADGLARTHVNLGLLFRQTGRLPEAHSSYEQARAIQEILTRENPSVTKFADGLARTHSGLGNLFGQSGRPAEALAAYDQARTWFEKLTRENPSVTDFANGLARTHGNVGNILRQTGRPAEALAAFEQARAIQQILTRENPSVTEFSDGLATTLNNLGLLFRQTGRTDEALAAYEQARGCFEKLTRDNPSNTEFAPNLATTHYNLGLLFRQTGRQAEAVSSFGAAVEILSRLVDSGSPIVEYRDHLSMAYFGLAKVHRELVQPAEAAAATLKCKELWPGDAGELYDAACEFALCVPLVGQGKQPAELSPEEQTERRKYADLAVEALQQSVAAGYQDLAHMQQDSDLDAIRNHPGYVELVQRLNSKPADSAPTQP